jgi:GH15 family glucan-1,4-alpha-glucosidase
MKKMSNAGGMLAEQVWDRKESPQPWLKFGQGTGSATPLAWTNAQFIRLAIAMHEGKLPEMPAILRSHFQKLRTTSR